MTVAAPDIAEAAARADAYSPFLRLIARRRPEIIAACHDGDFTAAIVAGHEEGETGRALRRERQAVALAVALADLSGRWAFERVVATLSDFADRALDRAIGQAMAERGGDGVTGFAALALGKHGGRELNYSSDIDPILLFDPAAMPCRRGEEPVEAANRIARRVVELLQARDADGYVFRVDLRLRPSPEVTPLALPIDAAIAYYESSALPWERMAFIRARAAAGDVALGRRFLETVRPFVWRRGVDYGAVAEMRAMSRRIRSHYEAGQRFGPGYDLKRGRGGIREIEFFAQAPQLIHGGRDRTLRVAATLDALAALAAAGRIGADEAARLADAYRALRTAEHRAQMVDDHQTHLLPADREALDNLARLDGGADGAALIAQLAPHVAATAAIFETLADDRDGDHEAERSLAAAEPAVAEAIRARIEAWRGGALRVVRTPAARAAFEAALPTLVPALIATPDPIGALARLDALLARLPTAIDLFRLIEAQPPLARLITDLVGHAPALGDELGRNPRLLDGLLDASAFEPAPPVAALIAELAALEPDGDYQARLDAVRRRVGERRFALGAQLVTGLADPIDAATGYARVAEAALDVLAAAATAEFEAAHGRVPGGELVAIGLGRLGGGSLTHASDLDLVFLFTGDHLAESDGRRPLGATLYFNRLAQRVTAALSVPTAAGPLYAVDTRLRPSGGDGLLAVTIDSFARYQAESAWTWEHLALCRARPVYGSSAARAEAQAVIDATLRRPRDGAKLRADAREMRATMARHKPAAGPFDAKLMAGGLVDLEFAVHVLQLGHGVAFDPRLEVAVAELVVAGLLDPGMIAAHRLLTRLLVILRLVRPGSDEPPPASRQVVARACGCDDWAALVAAFAGSRALVAAEWARIGGGAPADPLA